VSFLENYQPVEERIRLFWEKYPTGRIHTEIVLINEQEIVIKASIFRDAEDSRPAAIDFAQETRGSSNINKQSFVENGSTSAIGRGLATLGFAPKGARPSREEMKKVTPIKPKRNYVNEAQALLMTEDLPGLQEIYKLAKADNAPQAELAEITALGKQLSDKGKPPTPQNK
jgi:hypothetical protein